jgi:hypothetical protein
MNVPIFAGISPRNIDLFDIPIWNIKACRQPLSQTRVLLREVDSINGKLLY